MNWIDRGLLLVLALGVWALVLKPSLPNAHEDDRHACDFEWGGGYGQVTGGGVNLYTASADVECYHF